MAKEPIGFNTGARPKKAPLDPLKEVHKIQRKLSIVMTVVGELDSRIEALEVMEVQAQLNALNAQVKALRQDLLMARRTTASNGVTIYTTTLQMVFALTPHPTAKAMIEFINGLSEAAVKRIQETTQPEQVTLDVFSQVRDRLKKLVTK